MSYPAPPPPPQPDYFRATDNENALMVFRVKGFEPQYSAWSEPQPAVRCDVEAIDPPAGPWHDAWVGNELIVGQLKGSIGKTFFARLVKRGRAFVLDPIGFGDETRIDAWRETKKRTISQAAGKSDPADKSELSMRPFSIPATAPAAATSPAVTPSDDVPF
jgi:hypothetical protein